MTDEVDARVVAFIELNEKRRRKTRMPWPDRLKLVTKAFPSITELDWHDEGVLVERGHPDEATMVLANIMRRLIKVDQVIPGQRGDQAPPDFEESKQTWRELMRRDFATAPFPVIFESLAQGDSVREIAAKTHIAKSRVDRLRRGQELPTTEDMKAIAEAYGRRPAIFLEYRQEFVLAAVMLQLDKEPELVTALYAKIMGFR